MKILYSPNHKLFEKQDTYSLRGICMLLIICHHVYHYLVHNYGIMWDNSLFNYFINSIGYWSTGCFFLLSGFGLNSSLKNKPLNFSYVKSHLLNLFLPYLYAYIINISLTGEFSMFLNGWFYKTIVSLYIISFAIYHYSKDKWIRLSIISILVLSYIIYANIQLGLMHYYTNSIICFPIGILCSIAFPTVQKKLFPMLLLCFSFLVFVALEKLNFIYSDYFLAIIFSFICIYLTSIINITCKLLDYIGKKSIMFYVLQIALLEPMLGIKSAWLYSLGIFVIIYLLTYTYYKVKAQI